MAGSGDTFVLIHWVPVNSLVKHHFPHSKMTIWEYSSVCWGHKNQTHRLIGTMVQSKVEKSSHIVYESMKVTKKAVETTKTCCFAISNRSWFERLCTALLLILRSRQGLFNRSIQLLKSIGIIILADSLGDTKQIGRKRIWKTKPPLDLWVFHRFPQLSPLLQVALTVQAGCHGELLHPVKQVTFGG